MKKNKLFILLPDGVGLRNFAYSGFYEKSLAEGFDVTFWNNTAFDLKILGYPEIRIQNVKLHPFTDIYKKAKVQVELNLNIKKANDMVYESYRFPFKYNTVKQAIKSNLLSLVTFLHSSEKGLLRIRKKINNQERKTAYYQECLATLKKERPALVFCTNQRHVTTIAPLLAAQDLGIPTIAFIYSWDNLPKATLVVETDYYIVWSDHMKQELQYYYPYIQSEQIFVTGSPQFEMHFHKSALPTRDAFCNQYGLDPQKKYVCFSGNDVTSSPDDPKYLEDIALAVQKLNKNGHQLGIIFRKCPVDFSTRFDAVVEKYSDVIVPINPIWKPMSSEWNSVLPDKEDDVLLSTVAEYSEMVITIGSSTVFDFIAHQKPCGYLKYNQKNQLDPTWDVYKCYQYVHFRSMPNQDVVFWLNSANEIADKMEAMLQQTHPNVIENAQLWFEKINQHPPQEASKRIIKTFKSLLTAREITANN